MTSSFWSFFQWLYKTFMNWWQRWTGPVITLDSGLQVRVGPQLAVGGFSYVFTATLVDDGSNTKKSKREKQQYALKRIVVSGEREILEACLKEAEVHYAVQHDNLMPLLGFLKTPEYCYMLFPLCSHSLRDEVNRRTGLLQDGSAAQRQAFSDPVAPWSEVQALQLFLGICAGVQALHAAGYTHRDIKLENCLLQRRDDDDDSMLQPVLMDFGSAGPLSVELTSRHECLAVPERAAQHTTLPYRPPELLDTTGLLHVGDVLDYRAVDVWSLGCTLFALLYGASPMECEFLRSRQVGTAAAIRIVECTPLRILNHKLPTPPAESPAALWYCNELTTDLIPSLLQQDRRLRPTLPALLARVAGMIQDRGGRVPNDVLAATTTKARVVPFEQQPNSCSDDDDDEFSDFYSSSNNPV